MSAADFSGPLPPDFHPATRAWFEATFAGATPVQQHAWAAIAAGQHTLVIAPTGSGKTLAAFLHAIDQVFAERDAQARQAPSARAVYRTRVLYLSPIKALGADVERNLQIPLAGITAARARQGDPAVQLSVGLRTGDSTPSERARLVRRPPDILITTPESLYLMLTSQARSALADVHTVIIDEIHAVAGGKRGSHLALSLERLQHLLPHPVQRIGLSATVRPVEQVAAFLGGDRPVQVVQPASSRQRDVRVVVPVPDMADLAAAAAPADSDSGRSGSIWPHVEAAILEQVLQHRATLVFVNARGVAEKLTARLNELYARQQQGDAPRDAAAAEVLDSFTGSPVNRVTPPAPTIARSHHGSVSKEQRAQIEQALKAGELRCVVATSSLELGIDMGPVDLVIQVAAPPSIASALQRVGRAGHHVGGVSRGRIYPRTRRDLLDAAVVVDSMRAGRIEAIEMPRNPLDVLAQQTVAAVAMGAWTAQDWFDCVRRAAPYRELPRSAFDAVLGMLAGHYPDEAFAGLRPRLVWNRDSGELTARPGARQLAVTSGGTIADRGMYSVVLAQGEEGAGTRRVGELDEEMVYESRRNDVITLGATSWRIEQITHDQVVVSPAPGRSARLPFWRGEGLGRPAELGVAIGRFTAELEQAADSADARSAMQQRLGTDGLDAYAVDNLLALVDDQRRATGVLPTDVRLLVEWCRDELGDWRVILHSPHGRRVHDPWALAVAARLQQQWGLDAAVVASDDGIVVRLPDSHGHLSAADLFVFDPEPLRQTITDAVGHSALFAARFRECAARALLLPRRSPGRRSPLWQQRLRSSQLLQSMQAWPQFPILIETARECLQDVYDLPALDGVMRQLQRGAAQLHEARTAQPSPLAAGLLFGYVAQFLYAGDAPAAERRAQVLSVDSGLLGELLGTADIGTLLDPVVTAQVERELQRLPADRHARGAEGVVDLLRELGPLDEHALAARLQQPQQLPALLQALRAQQRVLAAPVAGRVQWVVVEDAARVRDALGWALPAEIPAAFLTAVADPLGDLLLRHARSHGPFRSAQVAQRLGIGVAVAEQALQHLQARGRLLQGRFDGTDADGAMQWIDPQVVQRLRLRALQAAREATRPVPGAVYARLLLERHGVMAAAGADSARTARAGTDGVLEVIEQLRGLPLPASIWETQVFPARVPDYAPALLDTLLATGTVYWRGHAALGEDDGWVSLHLQDDPPRALPPAETPRSAMQQAIVQVLGQGGGYFLRPLAERVHDHLRAAGVADGTHTFHAALWQLVWQGQVGSDLWAPLRALGQVATPPRRARLPRRRVAGFMPLPASVTQDLAGTHGAGAAWAGQPGRWALLPHHAVPEDTARALLLAEDLLERHAVVTRAAAVSEQVPGGFPVLQTVYRRMEEAGQVLRGRFVTGLGGAQFADRADIDRLRELADTPPAAAAPAGVVALSALDPASPYGAVLPWPAHAGPRPVRRAGALVVLADGVPVLYLAQGGRALTTFGAATEVTRGPGADLLQAATQALAGALRRGRRQRFTLQRIDGAPVARGPLADALRGAGFSSEPGGLGWQG